MLSSAIALLKNGKQYWRQGEQSSCRFTYVALKRKDPEHQKFFDLIDHIANGRPVVHPRLSEYVVGDFCGEHVDTIPDIVEAVSVRFDEGLQRLVIGGKLVEEGGGKVVRFNPHIKHEVLPIETGSRIVLIFWITGGQ